MIHSSTFSSSASSYFKESSFDIGIVNGSTSSNIVSNFELLFMLYEHDRLCYVMYNNKGYILNMHCLKFSISVVLLSLASCAPCSNVKQDVSACL